MPIKGEAYKRCCKIVAVDDGAPDPVPEIIDELEERCRFQLPVLADANKTDDLNNDVTSVYFKFSESTSGVELKLYRCDEEVATLNDGTYGTFYPYGFHEDDGKKYIGYKINWRDILLDSNLGEGEYYVEASATSVTGTAFTERSFLYCLSQYLTHRANHTVRLEFYHNGIFGDWDDDQDVTSMVGQNWYNSIRVPNSIVYKETSDFEEESIQYRPKGKIITVSQKQTPKWEFLIENLPAYLHRYIKTEVFSSDEMIVTDYNFSNPNKDIVKRALMFVGNYEPEYIPPHPNQSVVVTLEQKYNRLEKKFC